MTEQVPIKTLKKFHPFWHRLFMRRHNTTVKVEYGNYIQKHKYCSRCDAVYTYQYGFFCGKLIKVYLTERSSVDDLFHIEVKRENHLQNRRK